MLGGGDGEWGLGVGWELMVQWFVSWTPDQEVHNGAQARVTVSCSQGRHLPLSMLLTTQGCKMVLANLRGQPDN